MSLGHACRNTAKYDKAEQNYLQALQIEYNNTSAEPLTNYYGNPLTTDCNIQDKVDLMSVASPEDRLTMITHITPDIIIRLGSLGDVYNEQKKYSTAEVYYMKSLQFIHDLYGEEAAVSLSCDTQPPTGGGTTGDGTMEQAGVTTTPDHILVTDQSLVSSTITTSDTCSMKKGFEEFEKSRGCQDDIKTTRTAVVRDTKHKIFKKLNL